MVARQVKDSEAASDSTARPARPAAPDLSSFGDEFRELARQRRFVREAERAATSLTGGSAHAGITREPAATTPPLQAGRMPARARAPINEPIADQRISGDAAAMLAEMSRLADRVVESREALGAARARADRAEGELSSVNDRMMAARALVHEAQRTAHAANERCAWLEGRNETLQDALELAVNASLLQRWKWRRRMAAQSAAVTD